MKLASGIKQSVLILIPFLLALYLLWPKDESMPLISVQKEDSTKIDIDQDILKTKVVLVDRDVPVEKYFEYIDSIVTKYDSLTPYRLSEHLLVRSNPWIIDTLINTDYYRMIVKDSFVYDQKKMIVLPKDSRIVVPDSIQAEKLLKSFEHTVIDLNIPEFKLRIFEDSIQLFECLVRVGKDEKKYLSMAGRTLDLKTKTGKGSIVSYVRNPDYYNPVNGHRYYTTHRDDNHETALPQIPFLVPEIGGILLGQLIHPTTNPKTLGKASSNGCIGTSEADAWVIYYFAPIGTKVNIRYDLKIKNANGKDSILKDVYKHNKNTEQGFKPNM